MSKVWNLFKHFTSKSEFPCKKSIQHFDTVGRLEKIEHQEYDETGNLITSYFEIIRSDVSDVIDATDDLQTNDLPLREQPKTDFELSRIPNFRKGKPIYIKPKIKVSTIDFSFLKLCEGIVSSHSFNQHKGVGNCWLIATLYGLSSKPCGVNLLSKMISVDFILDEYTFTRPTKSVTPNDITTFKSDDFQDRPFVFTKSDFFSALTYGFSKHMSPLFDERDLLDMLDVGRLPDPDDMNTKDTLLNSIGFHIDFPLYMATKNFVLDFKLIYSISEKFNHNNFIRFLLHFEENSDVCLGLIAFPSNHNKNCDLPFGLLSDHAYSIHSVNFKESVVRLVNPHNNIHQISVPISFFGSYEFAFSFVQAPLDSINQVGEALCFKPFTYQSNYKVLTNKFKSLTTKANLTYVVPFSNISLIDTGHEYLYLLKDRGDVILLHLEKERLIFPNGTVEIQDVKAQDSSSLEFNTYGEDIDDLALYNDGNRLVFNTSSSWSIKGSYSIFLDDTEEYKISNYTHSEYTFDPITVKFFFEDSVYEFSLVQRPSRGANEIYIFSEQSINIKANFKRGYVFHKYISFDENGPSLTQFERGLPMIRLSKNYNGGFEISPLNGFAQIIV